MANNSPRSLPRDQRIDAQITRHEDNLNNLNGRLIQITEIIAAQTTVFTAQFQAHVQALTVPPPQPAPISPPIPQAGFIHPNLNLPTPPFFYGTNPMDLPGWSMTITQFIMASPHTFVTDANKIVCAGSLLSGPARTWYEAKVDPATYLLPPAYTLPIFLRELAAFFGSGITQATQERALTTLRQTTTVTQLAIDSQIITNTFDPLWADGPLIYILGGSLRRWFGSNFFPRWGAPDLPRLRGSRHCRGAEPGGRQPLPPPQPPAASQTPPSPPSSSRPLPGPPRPGSHGSRRLARWSPRSPLQREAPYSTH